MNLEIAVDRLYETGWLPTQSTNLDRLPDGRYFPTVQAVHSTFAALGVELSIKHNMIFNCHRATWATGTVVGSCEKEAAVFALAQLRQMQVEQRLMSV